MRRLAFALRLRSPLWAAVFILLLPYIPVLIHWITSPWRPGWYHIPAELVGDQTWVEGAPWPPNLKRDKVLVHNIWGTRIVDRSLFARTWISKELPPVRETPGVQPIFARPSEWTARLRDWNLEPVYLRRDSVDKESRPESVTLESTWLSPVSEEAVLALLKTNKSPWPGSRHSWMSSWEVRVSILFRVIDPEMKPSYDQMSVRDAITGQVVGKCLSPEFLPAGSPPRVYMLQQFDIDRRHRGPKIICLERPNDRLAYRLPLLLCNDLDLVGTRMITDLCRMPSPRENEFLGGGELGFYIGSSDPNIARVPMSKGFTRNTRKISTISEDLARFFEVWPEVELIQSGGAIHTPNVWSVLKLEHRKTALVLQLIYDPFKQKRVVMVLWGLWAGWLVLQFFFLRRFLKGRGYAGMGWLKTVPLLLEFGRSLRTLPHAQEIAVIPGVDITSWRSLRRFVIEQAGRK